jgi:Flp pilus assembly protein TadG
MANVRPIRSRTGSGLTSVRAISRCLPGDRRGVTAVITALGATALIGFTGLGIDVASWQVTLRKMQGAADQAVFAGALASGNGETLTNVRTDAKAVTASHGYVDGQSSVTVAVNQPPSQGSYTGNGSALEVVIQQPQSLMFTGLFLASPPTVTARAVALAVSNGCVLSLNPASTTGVSVSGSTSVTLTSCSLYDNAAGSTAFNLVGGGSGSSPFTATAAYVVGQISDGNNRFSGTEHPGSAPTSDPYSSLSVTPSGTDYTTGPNKDIKNGSYSPGIYKSITLNSGDAVTLAAGTYYIEGAVKVAGTATLSGTGVTIVLTSSDGTGTGTWSASQNTVSLTGSGAISITAPTTGTYAGIAFYGDRRFSCTGNCNKFAGGNTQNITGAIYFPSQDVSYNGGATSGAAGAATCTQLIAYDITFTGNSNFSLNCAGLGTKAVGKPTLVE